MIATAAQRLGLDDEGRVRAFLARRPYENVLLEWLVQHDRSSAGRQRLYFSRGQTGEVTGAAYFGRQVVLAAQTAEAIGALANAAYLYRHERMIVAARNVAREYWEAVKAWHTPPRLVREHQPLFVVGRNELTRSDSVKLQTRLARVEETDLVAENSAAMIEHELGYDPRRTASGFRWNVRHMIERGMWWIALDDGRPSFFCHLGPFNGHTVQLQGVWTPPAARGRGIAKTALGTICETLLESYPTVSLYVNDFNTAALALYRRLGFSKSGELCTYLF